MLDGHTLSRKHLLHFLRLIKQTSKFLLFKITMQTSIAQQNFCFSIPFATSEIPLFSPFISDNVYIHIYKNQIYYRNSSTKHEQTKWQFNLIYSSPATQLPTSFLFPRPHSLTKSMVLKFPRWYTQYLRTKDLVLTLHLFFLLNIYMQVSVPQCKCPQPPSLSIGLKERVSVTPKW